MRRASDRAFATLFAIMTIAVVGAAILAVTTLLAADVRRTRNELRDAQLRQLLIAGALSAERGGDPVELPPPLAASGFRVSVARDGSVLRIIASDGSRELSHTLQVDGGKVTAARLD